MKKDHLEILKRYQMEVDARIQGAESWKQQVEKYEQEYIDQAEQEPARLQAEQRHLQEQLELLQSERAELQSRLGVQQELIREKDPHKLRQNGVIHQEAELNVLKAQIESMKTSAAESEQRKDSAIQNIQRQNERLRETIRELQVSLAEKNEETDRLRNQLMCRQLFDLDGEA